MEEIAVRFSQPLLIEVPITVGKPLRVVDERQRYILEYLEKVDRVIGERNFTDFNEKIVPSQMSLEEVWVLQKSRGNRREANGRFKRGHRRVGIYWEDPGNTSTETYGYEVPLQ